MSENRFDEELNQTEENSIEKSPELAPETAEEISDNNAEGENQPETTSLPPVYERYAEPVYEPAPQPAPKKKKRKWLWIAIAVAIAAYVIATVALISMLLNFSFDAKLDIGKGGINSESEKVQEHLKQEQTPTSEDAVSPDGKLTVKQIAKKVRTSVVGIIAEGSSDFTSSSVGSGIIMSSDGYIITNNHVVESSRVIQVVLDDGTKYPAQVVGTDARTDLAVVKIEAKDLPAASFGDSDKLEQGDLAVAIGNPAGIQLQNSVTSGIISAINRDIVIEDREMTLIQTDASINPGNSGGPLVNEYGQVIGINTVKIGISYYEGLGFAIPINTAKPIIDELISRGYIKGRPSLGISGTILSSRDAKLLGFVEGMYVEYVHPYSDAYKKGLMRGDIITKINGEAFSSTEDIKKIRDEYSAGDTVKLTVYRNGDSSELTVILMDEAELNSVN